jgi:hypothetical protein
VVGCVVQEVLVKDKTAAAVKKRPRRKTPTKPSKSPRTRVLQFPQAKGRTVEMIELIADGDFHCVSIQFQDKTDLSLMIDPALTFRADFYAWKKGNHRLLKRWPALRCEVG